MAFDGFKQLSYGVVKFEVGDMVRVMNPDDACGAANGVWERKKSTSTFPWVRNRAIQAGTLGVVRSFDKVRGDKVAVIDVKYDSDGKSRAYIVRLRGLEKIASGTPSAPSTPSTPSVSSTPAPEEKKTVEGLVDKIKNAFGVDLDTAKKLIEDINSGAAVVGVDIEGTPLVLRPVDGRLVDGSNTEYVISHVLSTGTKVFKSKGTTYTKEKENEPVKAEKPKTTLRDYLKKYGVPETVINSLAEFRKTHEVLAEVASRVTPPPALFVGEKALNMAIVALLQGRNVVLEGEKASGKNILASTLAYLFNRPVWNLSCHVHIDNASIVGADTFKNGEVQFRAGHIVEAMKAGGFVIMDEWNFARPEALAVMHAVTDHRREIDIPGYGSVKAHPAFRIICTMNYGYTGTRELNEALTDRFVVINVPQLDADNLTRFIQMKFPTIDAKNVKHFTGIFVDLQEKAKNGEISSRSISLRGILDALECIRQGLNPQWAVEMSVVNKTFDAYERAIVRDTVFTRISASMAPHDIFTDIAPDGTIVVDFGGVR